MVKKQKTSNQNLYNFDYESKEEKKLKAKKKKAEKKAASKKSKTNASDKIGQAPERKKYDDEIIIGVTRYPEKKKKENTAKNISNNKSDNGKNSKNNNSKNKRKNKKTEENKIKKSKKQIKKKHTDQEEFIGEYDDVEQRVKKAKRNKIIKNTLIIVLIIAAILLAMLSPMFNLKNITITGNSKITREQIISLSGICLEENIFRISSLKSERNIKQNAYIEEVQIHKRLPNTIEISVKERIPTFMLEYGNGYVFVNNQGYMLEISSIKLDLPILTGTTTSKEEYKEGNRLNKEDLVKLGTVIKIMDVAKNKEISNLITGINISDKNNYTLYLETEKKTAYLGDCTYLEARMDWVVKILEMEEGVEGEILVNRDVNKYDAYFRESV